MTFDRTRLRYSIAAFWLLDAALQLQPFMFTRGFADQILRPAGDGQPAFVALPVHLAADLVAGHPALFNSAFALTQLLLGLGLLLRRTARVTLVASIGWSLGVWWLGEGLGGVLSGHAMLLTGAPGAVAVYAVLAAIAWPDSPPNEAFGIAGRRLALASWTGIWLLGAILQLLPGQSSDTALASAIRDSAGDAPHWLAHLDYSLAAQLPGGIRLPLALAAVQALIGLAGYAPRALRRTGLVLGASLTGGCWLFGQALGGLTTGTATDPQTAPLLLLLALTVAAATHRHRTLSLKPTASLASKVKMGRTVPPSAANA